MELSNALHIEQIHYCLLSAINLVAGLSKHYAVWILNGCCCLHSLSGRILPAKHQEGGPVEPCGNVGPHLPIMMPD